MFVSAQVIWIMRTMLYIIKEENEDEIFQQIFFVCMVHVIKNTKLNINVLENLHDKDLYNVLISVA